MTTPPLNAPRPQRGGVEGSESQVAPGLLAGEERSAPSTSSEPRTRSTSLSPQDFLLLDQWGRELEEAFGETPYLVGSVGRAARDYRDVDVRMLLPTPSWLAETKVRLRVVNMAVTLWGRQQTGLPIDFQFQPEDEFHTYDSEYRGALGIRTRIEAQEARSGA